MDTIDQLKAFVATAQTGSFTAAADQLGVSNRLTSKYVAELEARLGVRLFQRTTRKVGLSPAGEDLLSRAPALLDNLDDLLADVSEGSRGFSGVIRISAPVTYGEVYVAKMLGRFAAENPTLSLDLRLSDSFVDLAAEGIDLAFRIGTTDNLTIKTRKLGFIKSVIAASPDYLIRHGTPRVPEQLANHICIVDSNRRNPKRWAFQKDGSEVLITVEGKFHVNSARAACELAIDGHGVVYTPEFAIARDIEAGYLTPVLEGFQPEPVSINAVYLEGRALPRKTRALIEFASRDMRAANAGWK